MIFVVQYFSNLSATKYFALKKMTAHQRNVFVEERKWDYRGNCLPPLYHPALHSLFLITSLAFGFAAAVLETLPVVGLIFTLSNRVGAAMWAHGSWSLFEFVELYSF